MLPVICWVGWVGCYFLRLTCWSKLNCSQESRPFACTHQSLCLFVLSHLSGYCRNVQESWSYYSARLLYSNYHCCCFTTVKCSVLMSLSAFPVLRYNFQHWKDFVPFAPVFVFGCLAHLWLLWVFIASVQTMIAV